MKNPIIKKAENFLPLWHCEITVEDKMETISLDAGTGLLIGICEDKILLRYNNIITKWVSLSKSNLKFYVTKY